jgi:uncharacterized protein (TIGR02453 family)
MLRSSTLAFLKNLEKNNDKSWFDANRSGYEFAKSDYEAFINALLDSLSQSDDSIASLTAKSCMFRINRDVRFSKNKQPYKNNFGASMNKGGKKSLLAGYYFHLEPGASFVGGGLWMPLGPELAKVRQEIDYCFDEFKKIVSNPAFRKHFGTMYDGADATLKRLPKGYEAGNPAEEFLKLKSFIAMKPLTDEDVQSPGLLKASVQALQALQPILHFINRALAD